MSKTPNSPLSQSDSYQPSRGANVNALTHLKSLEYDKLNVIVLLFKSLTLKDTNSAGRLWFFSLSGFHFKGHQSRSNLIKTITPPIIMCVLICVSRSSRCKSMRLPRHAAAIWDDSAAVASHTTCVCGGERLLNCHLV